MSQLAYLLIQTTIDGPSNNSPPSLYMAISSATNILGNWPGAMSRKGEVKGVIHVQQYKGRGRKIGCPRCSYFEIGSFYILSLIC